jgi:hypothetical protein
MWLQNFECPHCHERTISPCRKSFIGPLIPAKCPSCGGAVGVPYYPFVFSLPISLPLIVADRMIDSKAIFAIVVIAIGVLASWIYNRYMPLIAK